jgi:Tfp pilus assembly protein PilF
MRILGFDLSSSNAKFKITDTDKRWVEENFKWLIQIYGYPNKMEEPVLVNEQSFPTVFAGRTVTINNIIIDLCLLFGLSRDIITFEIHTDIRDFNIPYEMGAAVSECETELKKGAHKLLITNNVQENPALLLHSLIVEFIRIRLTESEVEFDAGGDDTDLFLYLAGIYFGFGVLLAQNLFHAGRSSNGGWEIKWNYGSPMPETVMAFSLATYANISGDNNPKWKDEFNTDFRKLFERAVEFIHANPNDLYKENEVKSNDLFNLSNEQIDSCDYEGAVSTLQKILFLTDDYTLKADVYNNIGYYSMRTKNYQQGISNFRKALALGPEYGFANDNLGYALIMTGELEEGLLYLQKAMQTGNNDPAYTHRNMALYYQRKKQFDLAEDSFQKAFAKNTPVDLLEYHYGEFLLELGQPDKAETFFMKSAEKKEEEGIGKL